jgi:hypothetical protein
VDNSGDGDSVNCPVCLVTFTTQGVGTPDTCDHTFYAACLQEWSKNENNCPVHTSYLFDATLGEKLSRESLWNCQDGKTSAIVKTGSLFVVNNDDDNLGWKLPLLCVIVCILYLYQDARALTGYI